MKTLKRQLLFLLVLILPVILFGQSIELTKNFIHPPSEYSLLPFWSLNGTLKGDKMKWQIDQMMAKGISGAFLHARAGLDESETPYFSDGFWKAIDTTIRYSEKKGFHTYLYDEDKWPSGSAGGRTIAANPEEFSKKVLFTKKMEVLGPQTITLNMQSHPIGIFAGRLTESGTYESASQVDLTSRTGSQWKVPDGRWVISSFEMQKDPDPQIDYLDSAAVAKFIEITHETYFKRYGEFFGTTIPGIFFDEIYANYRKMDENIVWTDDFLLKFRKIKGYDLTEKLPLIFYYDPGKSEKIRYDYFDVVKDLYVKAWFKQYADWCAAHKIWATGHTTEKLLHYRRQSDYFSTMGQLQVPGTDNEEYRYGFPRMVDWYNPKQISSIAHLFDRKRVMAESLGSGGYTIPLEEYKYGFSMLAVYGINLFIPHLFHYTIDTPESQADWPPSWFYTNPYWKYFKPLADFASRVSYMNSQGRAICDVAILFPLTDLWEGGFPDKIDDSFYKSVQQTLLDNHIDFDIIDPASLAGSKIEGNQMVAGNGKYRVLILPEIRSIRTDVIKQIASFVEHGGIVVGINDLPVRSESGPANDEVVSTNVKALFGFPPLALRPQEYYQWNPEQTERFTSKINIFGGAAYFTRFLSQLPGIINSRITPDFVVKSTNGASLRFNHRSIDSTDVFLLVNDRNSAEKYHVSLRKKGVPSIWNPETGTIIPFENFRIKDQRMELILDFNPRQSYFLLLGSKFPDNSRGLIETTDLEDFKITNTGKSIKLEGWGKTDQPHSVIYNIDNQSVERKWKSKQVMADITLNGDWQFQLVPHALDYTWSPAIETDTLALPVMQFQPERTNPLSPENLSVSKNHHPNWKIVKITDVFNDKPGIQRYLSGWDASWISYYDNSMHIPEIAGGERLFKKEIHLESAVRESKIAITADQGYELLINGKVVGSDNDWKVAEVYDISKFLQLGDNVVRIKTTQTKGLLLQGFIRLKNGQRINLSSDESWQVTAGQQEWQSAFRFADPPLGAWGNIENPLHKTKFPLTVWYRQQLPPGAIALKRPAIKGKYSLFINGHPVKFENGKTSIDISGMLKKEVNMLAVSVLATDQTCGLIHPVEVVCGKIEMPLISWNDMGIGWYSGRVVYSKKVTIPSGYLQKGIRLMLIPGKVNHFAEIWVNKKLVTFHSWAPFETDITSNLKEGENTISIVVANLQANQATWNILDANITDKSARWWHDGSIMREKEKLISGLLGPVCIKPYSREAVELEIK